ncbi:LANO_0H03752g1_1 [Lachancea nothofagi CBS 11611]|uniref:LANO_0H03752g1_1 n=1 Tax=Lachancea nothofagi CBS 11611 TaxID=1266666 RepID=A0A1G4KLA1_9SACH|nr:LANO_0H03752g1_1 [Lachancea nothofagi CBS 11611]
MPVNILATALIEGTDQIPYWNEIRKYAPYVAGALAIKVWSRGTTNKWQRKLNGKVYIVTGATTQGMGTAVALEMAQQGAQLVILVRRIDEWTTEWLEDLRVKSNNELIFLEQCDLSDLYQVRKFATKWLDNKPARRLDGVVAMAGDLEPAWKSVRKTSADGLELQIATNFAGTFHLLDLLKPSFKAQPPDRDVRIIVTTCMLQALGEVKIDDPLWKDAQYNRPLKFFGSSKLQLSLCMLELQRRLLTKDEKDERSGKNVTVALVQPGIMRSTSLRRLLSNGSVLALIFIYTTLLYPLLWLLTKSGNRGAQSVLYALMSPELEEVNWKDEKVKYVVNCSMSKFSRKEFDDTELQTKLYDTTTSKILELERSMAIKRNMGKKKTEKK